MRCFRVDVAVISGTGASGPRTRLAYDLPVEATERLVPIMEPYGQHPEFYFDMVGSGRPPAPWAIACLDQEYALAGHIASARPPGAGIAFVPYTSPPAPLPADYLPGVGVIVLASKSGLEDARRKSPIFEAAWEALADCDPGVRWLVLLDALPKAWLAQALPGDSEKWHNRPR